MLAVLVDQELLCLFALLVFILVSTVFFHSVSPEAHSSSLCKLKSKNVSCNLQLETPWVNTGESPAGVAAPLLSGLGFCDEPQWCWGWTLCEVGEGYLEADTHHMIFN